MNLPGDAVHDALSGLGRLLVPLPGRRDRWGKWIWLAVFFEKGVRRTDHNGFHNFRSSRRIEPVFYPDAPSRLTSDTCGASVERMADEKDRAQSDLEARGFRIGWYRHYKKNRYLVYAVELDEATLVPRVSYVSQSKGTKWSRTIDEFFAYLPEERQHRFVFERDVTPAELLMALLEPAKLAVLS